MLEDGFARAGKNLVQAWPGKIGEDFTPAADRRELWFTRDDVEAVRQRARLAVAGRRASRASGDRSGTGRRRSRPTCAASSPATWRSAASRSPRAARSRAPTCTRAGASRCSATKPRRRLLGPAGGRRRDDPRSAASRSRSSACWRASARSSGRTTARSSTSRCGSRSRRSSRSIRGRGKDDDVVDSILLRVDAPSGLRRAARREMRAILAERLRVVARRRGGDPHREPARRRCARCRSTRWPACCSSSAARRC